MKPIIVLTTRITPDPRTDQPQYLLRANYCAAVEQGGGVPLMAAWGHEEEYAAVADGLLLTGGSDLEPSLYGEERRLCYGVDPILDRHELALFNAFARQGKPILGICRGIQLINVALGGTLYQDLRQEFQALPQHSPIFEGDAFEHPVALAAGSTLARLFGPELHTNSFHHQAVKTCGAGLLPTAVTAEGVIEGVEHQTLPILGVQWHPERMIGEENFLDMPPSSAILWNYVKNKELHFCFFFKLKFKQLLYDSDITQKYLAELLHIKQNTYSQYENGQHQVPLEALITLARYYQTTLDYLVGISDIKNSYQ